MTSCTLEELPDFLAAADIAVVPRPQSAGIPTKLLNYMAAGKAIVSFAKSATILEDGKTARLVTTPTAEAFAEGLLSVLANPEMAASLGRNARSFIDGRFDWPSIVEQIEAVYDRLIREESSEPIPLHRLYLPRRRKRVRALPV